MSDVGIPTSVIEGKSAERALWDLIAALLTAGRPPEEIRAAIRLVHANLFPPSTDLNTRGEART